MAGEGHVRAIRADGAGKYGVSDGVAKARFVSMVNIGELRGMGFDEGLGVNWESEEVEEEKERVSRFHAEWTTCFLDLIL
jgi:hypothetical protein